MKTNFIQLTLGNNEPILIKADEITTIVKDSQRSNTKSVVYIKGQETSWFVLENINEVMNKIREV